MLNLLVNISFEQKAFLARVRLAMEQSFGEDQRRIDHALQVTRYAEELLAYVEADPVLTLTSAYLHDIGIPEAERKHGSSAGSWQEIEGPPVTQDILAGLGAEPSFVEQVADIVGHHHTSCGVDSPEFRIIWDADALVNFAGVLLSKSSEQTERILNDHMVTEPGFQVARKLFIQDGKS